MEPGGLQSMGSQRTGHDLATKQRQNNISTYENVKLDSGNLLHDIGSSNLVLCDNLEG